MTEYKKEITESRQQRKRSKKVCYLLFVICYLLFGGCVTTEYNVGTHRQDIIFYSTAKEIALGQNIAKRVAAKYKISSNPYDIERINDLGRKIVSVSDRKAINYYFYVIEDDKKNAFSIPGGYVYVNKGLLDLLSDDELAFVIAHEVGHIVSRHAIKRLQASIGYNLLILASVSAPSDPQFAKGVSVALAQILSGYSQEDELNADELAVKYSRLAGFNPKAGIEVLEKLYQEGKKVTRPISYFRTHPFTAQRVRRIKETLHLPLGVEDYINF